MTSSVIEVMSILVQDPRVIGAAIGAIGTLIVGITVLIFTNRGHNNRMSSQHLHERKLEHQKHLREKIEQTYLSFSRWETYFGSVYVAMTGYVKGEMSGESAFKLLKNDSVSGGQMEQTKMLVALYFPDLQSKIGEVSKARSEVVKYFPTFSEETGDIDGFFSAQLLFEKRASEFKDMLVSELEVS